MKETFPIDERHICVKSSTLLKGQGYFRKRSQRTKETRKTKLSLGTIHCRLREHLQLVNGTLSL